VGPYTAQRYHELTKYDEVSVRAGRPLDWSTQPSPFKEIVSKQRIGLREYLPFRTPGQKTAPDPKRADSYPELARLSRVLFLTNGVTGVIRYGHGAQQPLRAAPSAGALYPTEIYVGCSGIPGLDAGLYAYQPLQHELVRLWEDDPLPTLREGCGGAEAFDGAALAAVCTGIFWRSAWRYQERGYRRVLLDTGHVIGNLVMACEEEGLAASSHTAFFDDAVNGLFFFDDSVEGALAVVPLGMHPARGPLWATPAADPGTLDGVQILQPEDLASSATVFLHRASKCDCAALIDVEPGSAGTDDAIALPAGPAIEHVPAAIVRRRSARRYKQHAIELEDVAAFLRYAFAPVFPTRHQGWLRAFLIATRVDRLEPGIYEIEGAGAGLRPLSLGDATDRVYRLCLGQELARDGAATVVFAAESARVLAEAGERAYRYLHLEAGEIGERLQVAARAVGAGTCGIGGFFDDDAAQLVGLSADDWVLYLVTLGQD